MLILNAIALHGMGTALESLGLASAYNHPFASLAVISIAWIAMLWSGVAELNKPSASDPQAVTTIDR